MREERRQEVKEEFLERSFRTEGESEKKLQFRTLTARKT